MLMAMVMFMTMVMERDSPFDLWELCTYMCIVTCGSLIPFTLELWYWESKPNCKL